MDYAKQAFMRTDELLRRVRSLEQRMPAAAGAVFSEPETAMDRGFSTGDIAFSSGRSGAAAATVRLKFSNLNATEMDVRMALNGAEVFREWVTFPSNKFVYTAVVKLPALNAGENVLNVTGACQTEFRGTLNSYGIAVV